MCLISELTFSLDGALCCLKYVVTEVSSSELKSEAQGGELVLVLCPRIIQAKKTIGTVSEFW